MRSHLGASPGPGLQRLLERRAGQAGGQERPPERVAAAGGVDHGARGRDGRDPDPLLAVDGPRALGAERDHQQRPPRLGRLGLEPRDPLGIAGGVEPAAHHLRPAERLEREREVDVGQVHQVQRQGQALAPRPLGPGPGVVEHGDLDQAGLAERGAELGVGGAAAEDHAAVVAAELALAVGAQADPLARRRARRLPQPADVDAARPQLRAQVPAVVADPAGHPHALGAGQRQRPGHVQRAAPRERGRGLQVDVMADVAPAEDREWVRHGAQSTRRRGTRALD